VLKEEGNIVYQPKPCCKCNCKSCGTIGKVSKVVYSDKVDGAIAMLDKDIGWENRIIDVDWHINGSRSITVADLDATVVKRGARTGFTHGIIKYINYTTHVDDINFTDQIKIEKSTDPVYEGRGDSGSVVLLEDTHQVIGLHWGGPSDDNGSYGLANRIDHVIEALDIEFMSDNESYAGIGNAENLARWKVELQNSENTDDILINMLIERNINEILRLVNHDHETTILWRRNSGPEILRQLDMCDSIPADICGKKLPELLDTLGNMLYKHGSSQIRADLIRYRDFILRKTEETLSHFKAQEKGCPKSLKNLFGQLP
jgi:hypothetical protein